LILRTSAMAFASFIPSYFGSPSMRVSLGISCLVVLLIIYGKSMLVLDVCTYLVALRRDELRTRSVCLKNFLNCLSYALVM
jgi:hypothetical protein